MIRLNQKIIFGILSLTILLSSCAKDEIIQKPEQENINSIKKKSYVPGMQSGTLQGFHIYPHSGGGFTTPAAAQLFFETFTYPTNKYSFSDYAPWTPLIEGVTSSTGLLMSFQQTGNYYVAIYATVAGGLVYKYSSSKYIKEVAAAMAGKRSMPNVSEFVVRVGGNSDGIVVFTGKFLIDYSSPTGVGVFKIDAYDSVPDKPILPDL